MELWIRSQDRMTLCKCNNIYIDDEFVSPYYIKDDTLTLGKYSTKERALEVLDEIHQRLINLGTLEIAPDSYKILPKDTNNVYVMPKE